MQIVLTFKTHPEGTKLHNTRVLRRTCCRLEGGRRPRGRREETQTFAQEGTGSRRGRRVRFDPRPLPPDGISPPPGAPSPGLSPDWLHLGPALLCCCWRRRSSLPFVPLWRVALVSCGVNSAALPNNNLKLKQLVHVLQPRSASSSIFACARMLREAN